MTEYGYSQERYRGFIIDTEHEGEDEEVTGYRVTVDNERIAEAIGQEVGSQMGGFASLTAARDFIDGENDTADARPRPTHTPGPWWAEHHIVGAPNSVCVTEDDGAARTIASIPNGAQDNSAANATLIAAAPDMYEALARLVEICDTDAMYADGSNPCTIAAHAALAKAEGR